VKGSSAVTAQAWQPGRVVALHLHVDPAERQALPGRTEIDPVPGHLGGPDHPIRVRDPNDDVVDLADRILVQGRRPDQPGRGSARSDEADGVSLRAVRQMEQRSINVVGVTDRIELGVGVPPG